jgi:hypothetical protein
MISVDGGISWRRHDHTSVLEDVVCPIRLLATMYELYVIHKVIRTVVYRCWCAFSNEVTIKMPFLLLLIQPGDLTCTFTLIAVMTREFFSTQDANVSFSGVRW